MTAYSENLKNVTGDMLAGAAVAEDVGGLIHDVWYNTIYEKSDTETDKYTRGTYSFNDDFNTSLAKLFSDTEIQNKINSIKTNQDKVQSIMKELQNPPEEYKEAYGELKNYYNSYLELTNLVINPNGNLQSYTSDFNNADSEAAKCYQAMKIYID